jgi:hypothetical protein
MSPHTDDCPITDGQLLALVNLSRRGMPLPTETMPGAVVAQLALYCFRRSHLEQVALILARTCSEDDLWDIGGRLGKMLFEKATEPVEVARPKITLHRGPFSAPPEFNQDETDDRAA